MKSVALILLCAAAQAIAAESGALNPNSCPKDWSVEKLLPHRNCNQFYQCWSGKRVVHTCPSNLHFSVVDNRCEWARNVECGDRVVPDGDNNGNGDGGNDNGSNGENDNGDNGGGDAEDKPTGGGNCNPAEAPSICAAQGSEDVLVAHEKCNKYYVCNGGKPVTLRCPGNLLFNPNTDYCDWPQNVKCGDRVVPDGDNNGNGDGGNDNGSNGDSDNGGNGSEEAADKPSGGGNCNPAEAPSICAAQGSEDVLVAHEKCDKYYVCNGGKPVALRCPANLLFNPNTDQCDWPQNVKCGDRVVPDGDNSGNGDGESDNGSDNGGNGGGDAEDKPSGGGNCNPAEAPSICAAEGSEDVLVAHEKCNKFYVCNGGKPVALRCPANLLFNPNTDQCDWPQNVECGDRVVPDGDNSGNGDGESDNGSDNGGNGGGDAEDKPSGGGNCNPAEAPSICAAEGSEDVLVAHENCNKFYVCNGGKPVALRCPANLLFNPNTDQCDWPQNVECGDRVVPDGDNNGNGDGESDNGSDNGGNGGGDGDSDNGSDNGGNGGEDAEDKPSGGGNCNPAEAPSICAAEGSEDVLVAHEKCNKFYVCNGGKPVALRCPANLLFNPNTDQCDWPQNVECGDRVVPDGDNNGNGDGESDNGSDNGGNGGGDGDSDNGSDNGGNGGEDAEDKPSGGGNCNPAEAPSICAAEGSEDVLVAHEKCNKFYVCNGGKPVALRCPANLLFNPNTDQCDWPQNVECGDRVVPDGDNSGNGDGESDNGSDNGGNGGGDAEDKPSGGGNCNPAEAPSICAAEGSEDVLVAHEKCNKFYVCKDGKPVALRCPANLLFNPNTDQCDWPQNVECGDRVVPDGDNSGNGDGESDNGNDNGGNGGGDGESDNGGNGGEDAEDKPSGGGNCNPAEAPSICAAEGSEDVLVAHEKCNKFYVCNGGKPVALRCPANLLFNPNTDQCDWPQNVECGDRVVPDGDNSGNGDGESDNGSDNGGNGGEDAEDKPSGGGNCNPAEAPSICAAEGSEDVLVAHEKCNKFYVCNGGKPVALRCPANLLFNPNTDQCDWPQNVECGDRVVPDGDNSGNGDGESDNGSDNGGNGGGDAEDKPSGGGNCNPAEAPSICAAEGSEDVLVAHEKCNKFYVCNDGKPVALRCPANLLFNPNTDQCDWPQNVECGDRVVPDGDNSGNGDGESDNGNDNGGNGGGDGESDNGGNGGEDAEDKPSGGGNCNPAEAPSICAAEGSEDVLVAHEKCNKFYVCNGGKPVALRCPANLLFNPNTDQCDWPQNVECGDRVVPDGDNSGNGDGESDNGSDNGGNGGEDAEDKPSGGGNGNPAEAPSICAAEGSEDVLVAHEKCNKFYVCNGGKPVALRCPANLLFNPNTDQCDWPQNVECGDRVVPDGDNSGNGDGESDNGSDNGGNGGEDAEDKPSGGGNCNPAEAPSICAAEGSEDVLVAHEKCNKFYVCNGGKPVALRCPANLLFNPNTDQCDWPQNVECGDRVVPDGDNSGNGDGGSDNGGNGGTDNGSNGGSDNGGGDAEDKPSGGGNCNPAEAPSICAAEGSEDVLVAHEKCNKFYVCNGGKPVALRCPANLLFNPNTDQCDWPQNVECGDRVVPDGDNSGNGDGGSDNGGNGGNDNGSNGGSDNGGGEVEDKPSGGGNCNPAEAPSICAAEDSEDVLVAHEKCNKFYVCNGGKPVALRCPANLLFNPNTDQCDWPQNVECGDRVVPDGDNSGNGDGGSDNEGNGGNDNGSNGGSDNGGNGGGDAEDKPSGGSNCNPAEAPSICAAEGSEGVLVAHEKCNKFYVCNGGKPVALRCPANLLFNPNTDQCDWPQNVECGERVVPDGDNSGSGDGGNDNGSNGGSDNGGNGGSDNEGNGGGDAEDKPSGGGNCNPAEAPSICAAEGSQDVLVAHEKCNKFYVCNGGKPVALRCPGNLLFNPNTDQCDWPQNVECGDRVVPDGDNSGNGDGGNDNGSNGGSDNGGNGGSDNGGNGGGDAEDKPSGGGNCNPAEAPSICAAEGSEDVLVAHEKCNKFYVCNGGKPVTLRCPGNLLFNPNTDQCDWPQNVECGDRVAPDGNNNGNEDGGNDNGSNGGSDNGNNGGNDNVGNGGSDNEGNSGSDNGGNGSGDAEDKPSGGGNCSPAEAPTICAAQGSEDVLVAHEKCNKYYVCNGGKPVALRCPGNLLFNPNTDYCDWPENVSCGDRVVPDGDNSGNGDGGNDNESNGESDNGGNGGGDAEDKPSGGGNCNPAEAPSICAAQGSEDVLVAHEKCNKFYVCSGGKPVTLRCPGNLLFNPNTDECDWPQDVDCGDRVVPGNEDTGNGNDVNDGGNIDSELVCDNEENGAGNSDPNQARAICAKRNSEGVLVAHERCNQFYICDNGKPVSFVCPSNLLFNPRNDKCEWSHCVDCGQRIVAGGEEKDEDNNVEGNEENGNDDPSKVMEICGLKDSEGVLVAHEECNKFYMCQEGTPVVLNCPLDLFFNPGLNQCDWPENVSCRNRIVPTISLNKHFNARKTLRVL